MGNTVADNIIYTDTTNEASNNQNGYLLGNHHDTYITEINVPKVNVTQSHPNKYVPLVYDGYWYYDESTLYIHEGEIMGGDGQHYSKCRFRGEFKNGKASVCCARGSIWDESHRQEWVYIDNTLVVNGGEYIWRR